MMNKNIFCLVILFLFLGLLPLQGQGFVFKKDIVVEKDEIQDNVISLGGENPSRRESN